MTTETISIHQGEDKNSPPRLIQNHDIQEFTISQNFTNNTSDSKAISNRANKTSEFNFSSFRADESSKTRQTEGVALGTGNMSLNLSNYGEANEEFENRSQFMTVDDSTQADKRFG